jgi:hypothetical protein
MTNLILASANTWVGRRRGVSKDDWYKAAVLLWLFGGIVGVWGAQNIYVNDIFYMMIFPYWLPGVTMIFIGLFCCVVGLLKKV